MTGEAARPPLDQRATFSHWTPVPIRFGDTDMLGHVNNAVFATLSETGRVAFIYDPSLPRPGENRVWVIARLEIDYRAEVRWPAEVDVGTALVHVGQSSIRFGQGMFWEQRCVATSESVTVMMDLTTRRSVPIARELRAALVERLIILPREAGEGDRA